MTGRIDFTVYGIPQTKGSTKTFVPKGWTRAIITNDNTKNKSWAQTVSAMAQQHRLESCPWAGPIKLKLIFRLPIPMSLPKRRPSFAIKRPDLDKCTRSVCDALKGVLYRDDSQVVALDVAKVYGPEPGVIVSVEQIDVNYEGPVVYAYRPYDVPSVHSQQQTGDLYATSR